MTEYGRIHTDGSRSGGQPVVDREPIGFKNGRLMAQHDCYTLESNPYHAGTKAHADFITAFTAVRTERLCNELDITNADHIALWLECNMGPSAISYLAVKIVEAHEAALRQPTQADTDAMESILWVDTIIDDQEAIAKAFARHRLAERAAIVAWLMREEDDYPSGKYSGFAAIIREEIEAGEHLK